MQECEIPCKKLTLCVSMIYIMLSAYQLSISIEYDNIYTLAYPVSITNVCRICCV